MEGRNYTDEALFEGVGKMINQAVETPLYHPLFGKLWPEFFLESALD